MYRKSEDIVDCCDYFTSQQQLKFDYPFHKVDKMLFKKAIEDLVLVKIPKIEVQMEDGQK